MALSLAIGPNSKCITLAKADWQDDWDSEEDETEAANERKWNRQLTILPGHNQKMRYGSAINTIARLRIQ